jgi:hypothetical protein
MSVKKICFALLILSLGLHGCFLDTDGAFELMEDADAADQFVPDVPQDAGTDESEAPEVGEDVVPDTVQDVSPEVDVLDDVLEDVVNESDASLDVTDDVPADVITEDTISDAPVDSPEADVLQPVECFGVPTEVGNVMICAELPNGTGKSLMIKAELDYPSGSGTSDIPFKSMCWSTVGVGTLACFPCPGANLCWPVPDAGLPRVPAIGGTVVKFQPGIADYPGGDMKNTLCDLGKCYQGRYTLYSGHAPVCSLETDGVITGGSYEGTGKDMKIVCQL